MVEIQRICRQTDRHMGERMGGLASEWMDGLMDGYIMVDSR